MHLLVESASFFLELFQQKRSAIEIKKNWDLTPASLHLYLRKLEDLDLIHVSSQQKISFKVKEPLGFGLDSKVLGKEVSEDLAHMSKLYGSNKDKVEFRIVKPMKLSDELRKKMYHDLFEVISRFAELSEKYFVHSEYPVFNLVTCDYQAKSETMSADITNVTGFD